MVFAGSLGCIIDVALIPIPPLLNPSLPLILTDLPSPSHASQLALVPPQLNPSLTLLIKPHPN